MKKSIVTLALLTLSVLSLSVSAQKKADKNAAKPVAERVFTDVKINPTTSVKNQASSGTCWSFSGIALVESELLRRGKDTLDLSEMWIVRHSYFDKAIKYARMHGSINLAGGGATHDVFNVIDKYGIVPENVYTGLNYGTDKHLHGELDRTIKAYMDAVIANPNRSLSTAWQNGLNGILDAYLGAVPAKFTYNGVEYTPRSFADSLGLKGSDYQSYTSFTHHPFGVDFAVEVPDNWAWCVSRNVPLDQFIALIDKALSEGKAVLWASDVSEKGFQYNKGFAVLPQANVESLADSEKAKWSTLTEAEKKEAQLNANLNAPEVVVTQKLRQQEFDNYKTTDDHGMLIVGTAVDQHGTKYYKVKNSWGDSGKYHGYFYASKPFVAAKTMNIVIAK
ncbi:MAG: C1 family peptidase [Mucinivorans sp.]